MSHVPEPHLTDEPYRSQIPSQDEPQSAPPNAGAAGYGPSPTAQGVRGYRDLPADDVATINAIKELQEQVARVWAMVWVRPGVDNRWASRARDHIEDGISALVRSIAKPHDPFLAALQELADAATSGRQPSTQEQNLAQPSHDHRPDEGSRA